MKLCRVCNKDKPASDFGVRRASPDGLANRCKACQRDYDSARLRDPKRMKMRRDYQKTEAGKAAHNRATKKWVEKNTVKRSAHIITGNALRTGLIVKANCETCGKPKANAHHDDYAKPLDVRWLCDIHHKEWHSENGEGKNAS